MTSKTMSDAQFLVDPKADIPRMVAQTDIDTVASCAGALSPGDVAVEFGPWLGATSLAIAGRATLHVVDNFIWTKPHDRKVPGLISPGGCFQAAFEKVLAVRGVKAEVHKTAFEDFVWSGGEVKLCLIDSPKTAGDLALCLRAILPSMSPDGHILLKNGLSPIYKDMIAYLERLTAADVISHSSQVVERASNMLLLAPGAAIGQLDNVDVGGLNVLDAAISLEDVVKLGAGHPMLLSGLIKAVVRQDFVLAYERLAAIAPDKRHIKTWDKFEPVLLKQGCDADQLADFSEIFSIHNSPSSKSVPEPFHQSASRALRGFWVNNVANDWRARSMAPDLIEQAYEFGYMNWPSKIRDYVHGKDVLDVGCGPGLHGIGYLAAGAKSYEGLDPIVKPDRDRVKNITANNKMNFGWTPNDISKRLSAWHVEPTALGDTVETRRFDIATLHNVTEHLQQLDSIFADIALRMRKGGQILYNHDNFYSWNGHHLPPKKVSLLDPNDPRQLELIDWGHVEYEPTPDHYIARGLNRLRLDALIALTEKYFVIDELEEIQCKEETGLYRLTDAIRARYPYLEDRDFLVKNLFCVATVKI